MARTIAMLTPGMAETKTSTFPQPGRTSDGSGALPYLGFDASADEAAYFTIFIPQGYTSPLTVISTYAMASATSGVGSATNRALGGSPTPYHSIIEEPTQQFETERRAK